MQIIKNIKEWQIIRNSISEKKTLGFVPTMGCLHKGHQSLIKTSVSQNDLTALSIFINPTQFSDPLDYQHYPKTLEQDIALADQLNIDYVIIPDTHDIYPENNIIRLITDHPFSTIMEGAFRPGHFNGMLTIVMKLLLLARAHNAYFGEKDYQQYFLVTQLIQQYFINTNIILCPTIREASGLPLSSRNKRLSTDERMLLEQLYSFLCNSKKHSLDNIRNKLMSLKIQTNYIETHDDRLFIALKIGSIRIIDNLKRDAMINPKHESLESILMDVTA